MGKRIKDNKIAHMHGVAEYMFSHAEERGLNPAEMYFIGLNHDIGYLNGKKDHENLGSELLRKTGVSEEITDVIKYHGTDPEEYKKTHSCSDDEIPKALALLWEADMRVDLSGEDVGYKKRLGSIGVRYGFESETYKLCSDTVDWLLNMETLDWMRKSWENQKTEE